MRSVLAAAAILVMSAGTADAGSAGTVVGVNGTCILETGGNRTPIALGAPVQAGDTVEVPNNGKLKLRMADGSVVAVAAGTRLTIAAYTVTDSGQRQDAKLSLGQGLVRSIVSHAEPAANFEVDTAVGTAATRSTDWFVETSPAGDRIGVLTGSVIVTSTATRHTVTVTAHQMTRLEGGHDPAPPRLLSHTESARLADRTALRERAVAHPEIHGNGMHRATPHPHADHRPDQDDRHHTLHEPGAERHLNNEPQHAKERGQRPPGKDEKPRRSPSEREEQQQPGKDEKHHPPG
jgi:hypothetical protein